MKNANIRDCTPQNNGYTTGKHNKTKMLILFG